MKWGGVGCLKFLSEVTSIGLVFPFGYSDEWLISIYCHYYYQSMGTCAVQCGFQISVVGFGVCAEYGVCGHVGKLKKQKAILFRCFFFL